MSEVSKNIADLVTIHTFLDLATNALEVPAYVREAAQRLGDGWPARIKRTDQNQFNVSIWRPSPRSLFLFTGLAGEF
jgi:hypothetical protein